MFRERARDPRFAVNPVEGGGRSSFDGNHTNRMTNWMMPAEAWEEENLDIILDDLTLMLIRGSLSWCVFPLR